MRVWTRAVLAVGYGAVGTAAFAVVALRKPSWICSVIGHDPAELRWRTDEREEAVCRSCGSPIVRRPPA